MECKGRLKELNIDFPTNKGIVSLLINKNNLELIEELKDNDLSIEIKKYREKHSLDANAYMWVLIKKISEATDVPPNVIYKDAIWNIGAYTVLPLKTEAVEEYMRIWSKNGLGWFCEPFTSKLKGYTNVRAYHGSSAYNTKEMSKLVDLIVEQCKELGIETKTPAELSILKEEWK
jgi:hypothetical protein